MNVNDKDRDHNIHDVNDHHDDDANRDPISGETGAHPVGTGIGAAGVGAAATAVGAALGGPVGGVVGAVAGSVIGGLAGKGAAEAINPTEEDEYWRNNYTSRPYYTNDYTYEDYQPAYRTGYEGYGRYYGSGRSFDEVEPELKSHYHDNYRDSKLGWDDKAKMAARDAWHKVERTFPGDRDHR